MDERAALARIADRLPATGDDCAVVDGTVVTTDMLHETTDFPDGTTRYTAGWRAVGASLSDVAGMGAEATAAVAVYAAPEFAPDDLDAFLGGAAAVCEAVGAEYVGGDLDGHDEFTVASTALGRTDGPVRRSGASPGQAVCVTGTLGRTAAALRLFDRGESERANALFRFEPRVAAGRALATDATAMLDVSDGLARSCHQLAAASGVGIALDRGAVESAIDDAVREGTDTDAEAFERGVFVGEDFELLCTLPADRADGAAANCPVSLTRIGNTVDAGAAAGAAVTIDDDPLPDRGFTHGG
jgi:thiamine-monophosphate kinase